MFQPLIHNRGHLPFSATGGALLFHLLSKLYERTSLVITTALLDRLTHRYHILETGNDSFRFKASSAAASAAKRKEATQILTPA